MNTTATIKAVAIASGFFASSVASAAYTISSGGAGSINFGNGFAAGGMIFNATAALNGPRVHLTDGGTFEAASAWYGSQVAASSFTHNFNFQLVPGTNTLADGFCFVIQANNPTALGPKGGGLGYGPAAAGATATNSNLSRVSPLRPLMTSSCPRNKFNFARLSWRPMERSPAQQMHMQMEHRLSRAGSGVHHRAVTISQFSLARQFRRHQRNLSQH